MATPTSNHTQRKPIDGALQDGAAQRPFTWCVLDRLLGEHSLVMAGSSGSSAGAMQAVALAASPLPLMALA
jgi:NTE family protein